ncbi:MAG: hypothetical protein ACYDGR_11815 [Candidatus Dormibacteria bacterium]
MRHAGPTVGERVIPLAGGDLDDQRLLSGVQLVGLPGVEATLAVVKSAE